MLTDVRSHFGGALAIDTLASTTKNFTADLALTLSTAVDVNGFKLYPDAGKADQLRIEIFTEAGITGSGASLTVEALTDDDPAFASALVFVLTQPFLPGAGGIAAGTKLGTYKLPEGMEGNLRLRVRNTTATAVGAGATISARAVLA